MKVAPQEGKRKAMDEGFLKYKLTALEETSEFKKTKPNEIRELTINPTHPEQKLKVGTIVISKIEALLIKYKDIFWWSPKDMTCVSLRLMIHKLNFYPTVKLVRQKKWKFAIERNEVIKTEVQQLL